jgi:hypothetical protein
MRSVPVRLAGRQDLDAIGAAGRVAGREDCEGERLHRGFPARRLGRGRALFQYKPIKIVVNGEFITYNRDQARVFTSC